MSVWDRRQWLKTLGLGAMGLGTGRPLRAEEKPCPSGKEPLALSDFRPKSMLHVKETRIEKPRYPVIDVHSHLGWTAKGDKGVSTGEKVTLLMTGTEALAIMDRKGVRTMVNLTGGTGKGLEETIAAFDKTHPGRFLTCAEPSYGSFLDARYPQLQADAIATAARAGAHGLKVLKTLGLYLR